LKRYNFDADVRLNAREISLKICRLFVASGLFASCLAAFGADWATDGATAQRDAWQRGETILAKNNAAGMTLLWKLHLDNAPREMHSLFPPLIADGVKTPSGDREIAVEAGSSDNLYGIDVATGALLWTKHFLYKSEKPQREGAGPLCPGGLVATPVLAPKTAGSARTVYAASSDGMLHQLNVADGQEVAAPVNFLPPNAKAYSLNIFDGYIYSTTAQGCGGNKNEVWGINLETKAVSDFLPGGNGGLWGRSGAAVGSDGTVYAPTGDGPFDPTEHMLSESLIAVTAKTLQLKDYYSPTNDAFMWKRDLDMNVTPAVFDYKGRELVTTSSKECRVFLLDSKSLGGADHRTPLYRSPLMCNEEVNFAAAGVWGSMATWQDASGVRWILTPFWGPVHPEFKVPLAYGAVTHGAIVAFKVEERDGKTILEPAWMSRDMDMAEPPVIANGVVYAYGNGEDAIQATAAEGLSANSSAKRIAGSTHAVIYALDGETGKELWSSGDQIKSFAHFSGLSVANGRVYLGTFDSTLYSFGLAGK
jgi:outer membrane protein assembly factor BamB